MTAADAGRPPAAGATLVEKLLAAHAGRARVVPGEIVNARIDLVVCHEVTTPPAVAMLRRLGVTKVFDPSRIVVTPDHFVPSKDILSAELAKALRLWREEQRIPHYYEVGNHGIAHALVAEKGHVVPGQTVVCGDSHATTLGALGAFATGIGSTDLAAVLATGELWFKVPASMAFTVRGALPPGVYAKDVILWVLSRIGVDGARYRAMEWRGPGLAALSMESRFTIANMAVEAGAKCGLFAADAATRDYVRARTDAPFTVHESDPDAAYASELLVDLDRLEPMVALPDLPSNGREVGDVPTVKVDQVYIGSCTNGRISDLRVAADVLRGRRVASGTRAIVVPATTDVFKQAMREGLLEVFAEAGCVVSTPTCGACLGAHMGVLGADEVCVSTTNRNFVGRMGSPSAKVYLASPATAAASAVAGTIADPRDFLPAPAAQPLLDAPEGARRPERSAAAEGADAYLWGV